MKKLVLLILSFTVLGSHLCRSQAPRTVLLEEFTQASCPPCAIANTYLDPILIAYYPRVIPIKYQVNWPGVDTLNLQDPADPKARVDFYDVYNTGVPLAVIDGDTAKLAAPSNTDYNGDPLLVTQTILDAELSITSPLQITSTYDYNSATDSIHFSIFIKNVSGSAIVASSPGRLRLMISLLELNIHFDSNPPGDNGEYDFYYVNRKLSPDSNGIVMPDMLASGDSLIYTYAIKPPTYIYNKNLMAVAAFVQDFGTSQVYQATISPAYHITDVAMTDNTIYPTGLICNETYTPSVIITNNGPDTITSATIGYYYQGTGLPQVTQNWSGSLVPGQYTIASFPGTTIPDNMNSNAYYFINNLNYSTVKDIIPSNNSTVSPLLTSVTSTSTLSKLVETFDENSDSLIGLVSTPIAIHTRIGSGENGFIANEPYLARWINNYGLPISGTTACGGYALSQASYCFPLYFESLGDHEALIFDKVYRSDTLSEMLTFQHAYSGHGYSIMTSGSDSLSVLLSYDCGQNWTTMWCRSDTALATAPDLNVGTDGFFIPTASQWTTDTVDLSSYINLDGVVIEFLSVGYAGNALYIDNINWGTLMPNSIIDVAKPENNIIYPNPTSSTINIGADQYMTGYTMALYDLTGRTVMTETLTGQLSSYSISALANGVYLYRLLDKNSSQVTSGKITIDK